MLAVLEEFEVVALRDRFPADMSDVDLFQALTGSGYVIITCDDRQQTREAEAKALRDALGVPGFCTQNPVLRG